MATRKKMASKQAKASAKAPTSNFLTLRRNELRLRFSDSHDLIDKLHRVTQTLSRLHSHQLLAANSIAGATSDDALAQLAASDIPDVLGPQKAYDIVTNCAGETDLTTKLGDIPGLDLRIFQNCVQQGVRSAGYKPGTIPASPTNTLWDVVVAIQGSPK